MNLDKRLKRIEDKKQVSKYLPVVFVDSEEEIGQYNHLIGPETIIFINDYGDEYA